jgi:endonuclease/exonuclease/phosphatase family metal-dependent hydrolase
VRVVTYNVHGFRDTRDRVIGVIRELAPDVLLLQETGPRRELRRLAASLGMRVAHDPWSPFRRRVKNAVLAAEPWQLDAIRLVRFERAIRWYPRGVLMARIHTDIRSLWAISVHLGLDGDERGRQAEELCRLVGALGDEPVVVGGDLNATPDRRSPTRVAVILRDVWHEVGDGDGATFPAASPIDRIDYVFVRGPVQIEGTVVGGPGAERASDHLPVSADIAVGRS